MCLTDIMFMVRRANVEVNVTKKINHIVLIANMYIRIFFNNVSVFIACNVRTASIKKSLINDKTHNYVSVFM